MFNKYKVPLTPEEYLRLTAAISRLKASSDDFRLLISTLEKLTPAIDMANRCAQPPTLQWSQGKAQLLDDILTFIGNSEKLRDDIKAQST